MYKFIYIDDEDMARELFKRVLDYPAYGFHLEQVFSTAEEAYQYLNNKEDIDAVITDIRMGDMSGLDFCKKVRQQNQEILLVCLTGYQEFEYAQRAIKCDVFDYLLKPILYKDMESLFQRMKQQLDKQKNQQLSESDTSFYDSANYQSIIDLVKQYVEQHYNKNITLRAVAEHVSMNPAYLSRFFKQQTQMNFIEYLTEVRMRKAMELLQNPTIRIGEISSSVGYKTQQHFSNLFREYTGYTPSAFRSTMLEEEQDSSLEE